MTKSNQIKTSAVKQASVKKWREENAERLREYRKKYNAEKKNNPEALKQRMEDKKKWTKENPKNTRGYGKKHRESCHQNWLRHLITSSKGAARRRDLIHEITFEDLITKYEEQEGLCAISKIKLDYKNNALNSISVDRIDNSIGYTKENVHLVAKWINLGRGSATVEDIKMALQDFLEANR